MKKLTESCVEELLVHEPANKYNVHIGDLHACKGDQSLLKQVWLNLISNAIKYSSRSLHPHITISSKEDNFSCTYFIKDNGVGFNSVYADKLFKVFQRLHSDEMFEGNGIGLALVKRIITKHKGGTGAESLEGKGATFFFSIPKRYIDAMDSAAGF